jgi:hypothetical protein
MNNVDKKLLNLNKILASMGIENSFLKESALQRSVDMVSYSRKVLNLFFPYLADRLVEISEKHKALLEEEKIAQSQKILAKEIEIKRFLSSVNYQGSIGEFLDELVDEIISAPDDAYDNASRLEEEYNALKNQRLEPKSVDLKNKILKINFQKSKGKIKVFYKGIESGAKKILALEKDTDIFSKEEKKIFLETGHAFNIHLRNALGGDQEIREGAVAMGEGVTLYNVTIYYNLSNPSTLTNNISNLYSQLLEYIAHESTHVQQFILGEIAADYSAEIGSIDLKKSRMPLAVDRGYLKSKDKKIRKNWIEQNIAFEEEEDNYDDILTEEQAVEKPKIDIIEIVFRGCPELIERIRNELKKDKNLSEVDMVLKYGEECSDLRKSMRAEKKSEEYHKDMGESLGFSEKELSDKEYFSTPEEVEAFIRGFRARSMGKNITLAKNFHDDIAIRFNNKNIIFELWNLYKEMYNRLNYPRKDLGTNQDLESYIAEREAKIKKLKSDKAILDRILGKK